MKRRMILAAAACAAFAAPAAWAADAAAPKAPATLSAVPRMVSLLQFSLQAPDAGPALAAPSVDAEKIAAFLNRAQAVEEAAAAHPIAVVPALPASAVAGLSAEGASAEVPPQARQLVLGAVGAALDGLSADEIEKMPPEQVARLARRLFDEVAGPVERPSAVTQDVIDRLKELSPQARARLGRYLGQAYDLLEGRGAGPVGKGAPATPIIPCLQREASDRLPDQPSTQQPLAREILRLLDDSDGPDGFNHFVVTLALDAYIEAEMAGRLRSAGERKLSLVDPRDGSAHEIAVRGLPVISEPDLEAILDRRLRAYGIDARRLNLRGPRVSPSRIVDALQHLYLADRLANAKLNDFRGDVLPAFLTSREPLDSARKTMAARRSPCNPRHVHNLLRLLFDIP